MKDMILNQTKIPRNQWRYGFRSSAATGCGWIATYNALQLLGIKEQPEGIIRFYQWSLPLINGNCGTFIGSIVLFFLLRGFRITLRIRRSGFDAAVDASDACILFYGWKNKKRMGAHYVTLSRQGNEIVGYNTFSDSVAEDRYGPSLEAFLRRKKFFLPILIGIRKKK